MALAIRPLHPSIGGEVTGIDVSKPLSKLEVAAIEAGMDKHAVLVFPNQNLTDDEQMAFTRNFGAIENDRGGNITKPQDKRLSTGMVDVSNLTKDGKPLPLDSRQRLFNMGNMLWHSDSSFRPIPAKYSLLSARVVNKKGGNTEFADMRAAYDSLDEDTKREIEPMICEHSLMYSRGGSACWTTRTRRRSCSNRCASVLCAPIRYRGVNRSICRRMPAASSACRCPRRASCCASSPTMPRSHSSSTCINGSCLTS